MYKTIIIAVDGSEASDRAADVGVEFAACTQADVYLVHVIDTTEAYLPEMAMASQKMLDALNEGGKAILDRAVARISSKITAKPMLIEGNPADGIIETCEQLKADLIVVGVDRRGKLSHFVLGSVADEVVRRATCPVITVHAPNGKHKAH